MAGIRKISWFRPLSGYESASVWRDKHRTMTQSFMNDASAIGNALNTAWINFSAGSANLAAQAATARINAETKAKFDELSKIDISS